MTVIDWNAELRKIEREYDGLPPVPTAAVARAQKAADQRARERAARRTAVIGASARLALVATLAVAHVWWPYPTACGADLAAFLGARTMILVGGLWVAAFAWRHRLALAHVGALLLALAGLTLAAAEALPRTGYVTVAGIDAAGWRCGAPADGAPTAAQVAPAAAEAAVAAEAPPAGEAAPVATLDALP